MTEEDRGRSDGEQQGGAEPRPLVEERRLSPYSIAVVVSISIRLTPRAAARPPMLSAMAPSTGYRTGAPEKYEG